MTTVTAGSPPGSEHLVAIHDDNPAALSARWSHTGDTVVNPGPCPRRYTNRVRSNVMTMTPSWLKPTVRTVSTPTSAREPDSRTESTSDCEYRVSPSNTGLGIRTRSHPRLAITFIDTSTTLWPVISARVNVESTKGRPNSVRAA